MKKKQEIKAGIIMDLTSTQDVVIGGLLHNAQTMEGGVKTMASAHRQASDALYDCILEIFPELKEFRLTTEMIKGKVAIHVRSHK
ncbi:hypothetical protein LCGC14_2817600 [marine sediment metagenome]|uniref:Uncharacterized protein n=1 Tax=marine sediment metagenome TaxID=412755 RepID=A0A0F8YI03_9ZZZZ